MVSEGPEQPGSSTISKKPSSIQEIRTERKRDLDVKVNVNRDEDYVKVEHLINENRVERRLRTIKHLDLA